MSQPEVVWISTNDVAVPAVDTEEPDTTEEPDEDKQPVKNRLRVVRAEQADHEAVSEAISKLRTAWTNADRKRP